DPVEIDADGDVGGPVDDLVVLPDLDADRVEVEHRVELLQRPRLPRGDLFQHRVGDVADRLVRQIRAEGGGQVVLDVPDRHPARVETDDHVIEPAQAPKGQRRLGGLDDMIISLYAGAAAPSGPGAG